MMFLKLFFFLGVISLSTCEFEDICGLENPSDADKIIGGQAAKENQFPWLVGLSIVSPFGIGTCTASIINHNWILTAAHCVQNMKKFMVYAGSHDLALLNETHRQYFETTEGFTHPEYVNTPFQYSNDIALIKLQEKLEFNDYVRPVCLPTYADAGNSFVNETVTATGWGRTRGTPNPIMPSELQFAEGIEILDNDKCRKFYQSIITEKIICIDTAGGKGICNGDSGGPLNLEINPGKYLQIGVADFGRDTKCKVGVPNGYARVTEFLEWIENVTGREIPEE